MMTKWEKMIACNPNESSLHTDAVCFLWHAVDAAHALGGLTFIDSSGRFSAVAVSNGPTFGYSYVSCSSLLSGDTNNKRGPDPVGPHSSSPTPFLLFRARSAVDIPPPDAILPAFRRLPREYSASSTTKGTQP